jgi:hypothetical protein
MTFEVVRMENLKISVLWNVIFLVVWWQLAVFQKKVLHLFSRWKSSLLPDYRRSCYTVTKQGGKKAFLRTGLVD